MASRRSVLIGLGGLVAGGGAILGTGAFDTVEAQRTVSVETADDADALLGLAPADRDTDDGQDDVDNAYVSQSDGTVAINLDGNSEGADGLNQNARTTIRNLVVVSNQGTQTVDSLSLQFTETPSGVTPLDTFSFPVDQSDGTGEAMVQHGDGSSVDILTGSNSIPDSLSPGDAVIFGLEVDLISGGNSDNSLPSNGSYTLTITAESNDS